MTPDAWRRAASELSAGRATLLGLWGDADPAPLVHMAVADAAAGEILVVSLACPDQKFPSVGALHPPAIRLERAIHSLYGYEPIGAPDSRPWLDLGFLDVQHPLGAHSAPPQARPPYDFLPVEGEALHQIPVGPVHAGIIEPGHFRFTASGETLLMGGYQKHVRLWNFRLSKETGRLDGLNAPVNAIAISAGKAQTISVNGHHAVEITWPQNGTISMS